MPFLILQQHNSEIKRFDLKYPATRIGRNELNEISISDPFVPPLHAVIYAMEEGGFKIEHGGSRNPFYVNEVAVFPGSQIELNDGDKIRFGSSTFIFKCM